MARVPRQVGCPGQVLDGGEQWSRRLAADSEAPQLLKILRGNQRGERTVGYLQFFASENGCLRRRSSQSFRYSHPRCPGHSHPHPIPGKWNSLILFLDQDRIVGKRSVLFSSPPSPQSQLDWQPGQRRAHSKCSLGSRMELITSNLPVASSSAL